MSSGGTCDEYGFVVPDEYVQAYRKHSEQMATRRLAIKDQWNVLAKELKEQGLQLDGSVSSRAEAIEAFGQKTRSCRKLCRGPVVQGIPPEFRPYVWPLLCGVEKARAAKGEQVYPTLLQRCEGKDRNHELELDLDRTFPGHPLLDRESAHGRSPCFIPANNPRGRMTPIRRRSRHRLTAPRPQQLRAPQCGGRILPGTNVQMYLIAPATSPCNRITARPRALAWILF